MHFVYFLPGVGGVGPQVLKDYGLDKRFEKGYGVAPGCTPAIKDGEMVSPGTDGAADVDGCCVSLGSPRIEWGKQKWVRVQESGKEFYMGWQPEAPPTPAELLRAMAAIRSGYQVELGDGNTWTVPVARRYPEGTGLPSRVCVDGAGAERLDVIEKYSALYEAVGEYADAYYALWLKEDAGEDKPFSAATAIDALNVNYHLWRAEANALGLITTDNLVVIAHCVVDGPAFVQMAAKIDDGQKKRAE